MAYKVIAYEPEVPSGRTLSRFPWHEATRSISTLILKFLNLFNQKLQLGQRATVAL